MHGGEPASYGSQSTMIWKFSSRAAGEGDPSRTLHHLEPYVAQARLLRRDDVGLDVDHLSGARVLDRYVGDGLALVGLLREIEAVQRISLPRHRPGVLEPPHLGHGLAGADVRAVGQRDVPDELRRIARVRGRAPRRTGGVHRAVGCREFRVRRALGRIRALPVGPGASITGDRDEDHCRHTDGPYGECGRGRAGRAEPSPASWRGRNRPVRRRGLSGSTTDLVRRPWRRFRFREAGGPPRRPRGSTALRRSPT